MRALIQRVSAASVRVDGELYDSIGAGIVVFLGVGGNDAERDAELLWNKIRTLRIFEDDAGKTNLSLADVQGACLVVSQFTLYADCRKGRRPSFAGAMPPVRAEELYDYFVELVGLDCPGVSQGSFGAMMDVELVNNGPFTIWLDTECL